MSRYFSVMEKMAEAVSAASEFVYGEFQKNLNTGGALYTNKRSDIFPDFVTETDRKSEEMIRNYLAKSQISVPFVGEETGGNCDHDRFFLVDPLDGTSNFVALRPHLSICAAYIEGGDVKAAVIADPNRQTLLKACELSGVSYQSATEQRRVVASEISLDDMVHMQIECEMPIKAYGDKISTRTRGDLNPMEFVSPLMSYVSGFRKSGSTALDIFNLVMGQKSIIISSNLAPHDIAAGVLIAREAGFAISDLDGSTAQYNSDAIVAAPKGVHGRVLEILK